MIWIFSFGHRMTLIKTWTLCKQDMADLSCPGADGQCCCGWNEKAWRSHSRQLVRVTQGLCLDLKETEAEWRKASALPRPYVDAHVHTCMLLTQTLLTKQTLHLTARTQCHLENTSCVGGFHLDLLKRDVLHNRYHSALQQVVIVFAKVTSSKHMTSWKENRKSKRRFGILTCSEQMTKVIYHKSKKCNILISHQRWCHFKTLSHLKWSIKNKCAQMFPGFSLWHNSI